VTYFHRKILSGVGRLVVAFSLFQSKMN